jgi:signal transduction histidine kinase
MSDRFKRTAAGIATLIILFLIIIIHPANGQENQKDSLLKAISPSHSEPERMHAMVLLAAELIPQHMDSARYLITSAAGLAYEGDGIKSADYYNTLGVYYWYKGELDSAIQSFLPITKMRASPEMLMRLARANNNAGTLFNRLQQPDSAHKYLHEALRIDSERGNEPGVAKTHYDLSVMYYRLGKIELALKYQLESIRINEEQNDTMRLVHGYNVLGNIYSSLNQNDKAIKTYLKVIDLDQVYNQLGQSATIYNNISALLCNDPETSEEAIAYANKGLEVAIKQNNHLVIATLHTNIASAYMSIQKPETSIPLLHKALEHMAKEKSLKEMDGVYLTLSKAHLMLGNIDSAYYYSYRSLELSTPAKNIDRQQQALNLLFQADSTVGNFASAIDHYQQSIALRDSMWNIENRNRISELQIIYETEQKEAANQLLSEQNYLNNKIIRSQKILIFLSVSILILTIVILFRERWAKKKILKKNEEILKQKEEINKKNAILTELNSTKDKFFSIIAHDLKGPFSSLVNLLEVLAEEYDQMQDDGKRHIIKLLHENSTNTYNLLVNLLDWSRAQTGAIENKPERIDLHAITATVFNYLETRARQKKHSLINEVPDFSYATADPQLLQSILINMVNNAIKFSEPENIIRITATRANSYWKVCVVDHGIGIPKDKINLLFRLDSNFKRPGTEKEPGTGLGLVMAHEFIQLIGGSITVESEPGKGSVFCITLPSA